MIKVFNLFVVMIVLLQHSVWASGLVLPYSPQVIESIIENYNSLSQEERVQEMTMLMEKRSASDKQFIKEKKFDLTKVHWPDLKYKDGTISFEHEGEGIRFTTDENAIEVNGLRVDLSPGKMRQAVEKLEEILGKKSFSLFDLIISPAYAIFPAIVLLALLAVAIGAYVLAPAFSKIKVTIAKFQCMKMKEEFDKVEDSSLSLSDANEIRSKVRSVLDKTNSDLSKVDCKKEPAICKELESSKKCYEIVQGQLDERFNIGINDSARGSQVKENSPFSKTVPRSQAKPR